MANLNIGPCTLVFLLQYTEAIYNVFKDRVYCIRKFYVSVSNNLQCTYNQVHCTCVVGIDSASKLYKRKEKYFPKHHQTSPTHVLINTVAPSSKATLFAKK